MREGFSSALYENRAEPLNEVQRTPSFEVKGRKKQSVTHYFNPMSKETNADADPKEPKENFEDLVGKEQSAKESSDTPKEGEQSDKKPDAAGEKPEEKSGETPGEEGESPKGETPKEGGEPEGDKLFWDKFKTEADAKRSYDEAQGKIIGQGKELNELKTHAKENEDFLATLDKALLKNPELAEQLKSAIAGQAKGEEEDEEPEEGSQENLDAKIERKLEERENKVKIKTERDAWIEKHPEFKKPEIGHKVLDLLEEEGLPFTAKTLDIAYNYVTKDSQVKKAKEDTAKETAKREEAATLEREEASAVGGGSPQSKGKVPQENPFDDLVGDAVNPNIVRN